MKIDLYPMHDIHHYTLHMSNTSGEENNINIIYELKIIKVYFF